ncbi:polysaccharide lyase family 8 super-sandwich domain-containing protein [Bacillus sp. 3255]|uniref:polysaccharide lyase family 8 super-sandwich domain-containing protein n=1 Tax=Bacillus sp. 3255 TaxID=2817904 RepID=UPI002857AE5C|nr:polysaccharide lyase family 8 super-sandwich domain-containing protein [Bacillus sp. 3255]MDR6882423.1 hyaluronate lyase [Bacillus sp. 3255]
MKKMVSLLLIVCMTIGMLYLPLNENVVKANGSSNIMLNGGFEELSTDTNNESWLNNIKATDWKGGVYSGPIKFTIDQTEYHSGGKSIKVSLPSQGRAEISQFANVEAGRNYSLTLWTKLDNVVTSGNGVYVRRQFYDSLGAKIGGNYSSSKTIGTIAWKQTKIDFTAPNGAVKMIVELFFDTGTGTAWYDDVSLVDNQTLQLDQQFVSIEKGSQLKLNTILNPTSPGRSFIWSSSDPTVATVYNGIVNAIEYGSTTITATSTDGLKSASAQISVETNEMVNSYEAIRQKIFEKLTMRSDIDPNASYVTDFISAKMASVHNESGTGLWDVMDKSANRTFLWSDRASTTDPYHILYNYGRLKDMAFLYSMSGSPLYHNQQLREDIVNGMDWIYLNRYNENKSQYGNWFVWEIAVPLSLGELMVLMYDELSSVQINNYIRAIDAFVPDPTMRVQVVTQETGANLLDKAYDVALRGVLGKSSAKIKQALAPVGNEYKLVTSGDGVYEDGSIIQHTNNAYTGGYGQSFVNKAEGLLYMFHDSPWEISSPDIQRVFDWVSNAFEPLIYNGQFMQMINGRGIASGAGSAKDLILSILQLAETAPPEKATEIKQTVKAWIIADTVNDYKSGLTVYQRTLVDKLLNDTSLSPRPELVKHKMFAGMDRTVHLRPGWGMGISMFSDRVSAFEYGNKENSKGWFTGLGMTYIYNADQKQYLDYYWPTVDSFRLAGTTTDRSGEGTIPGEWASYMNAKNWVGGSSIEGKYGATGMEFSLSGVTGSSLKGKKSWFSFDDEIVALGSGINSSDNRNVETIIENRKLNPDGNNGLVVDGQDKPTVLGWNEEMKDIHWAHLNGNVADSDIGYYFPSGSDVNALREARIGSFYDINTNTGSKEQQTRNFLSLAFNHGVNPSDASYSYVLLPNKSKVDTETYSSNPDIEIIKNSTDVHAVREKKLGITAANFWNPSTVGIITALNSASIMVKESNGTVSVSIADPTQKQQQVVIDLGISVKEVVQADPSIQIVQTEPTTKLIVNTNGAHGRTFNAVFRTPDNHAGVSLIDLDGISITPSVSSDVYDYSATVPYELSTTSLSVTPVSDEATVTPVKLNGILASNPLSLTEGSNIISFEIIAEDGTVQPYTITVTRNQRISNAALATLNLSGISLNQTVSSSVYAYTANVANSISVTTVTYSTSDHNATAALQLNGAPVTNPIYLNEGSNVISIVIKAQDGTKQSYTANVYRAYSNSNSNAALAALNLSGISLNQTVSSSVYAYTANVANSISVTTVTYSTVDHNATAALQLNGATVTNPIYLNEGSNVINIVITAQNGTKQSYIVNVYRAYSSSSGSTGTNTTVPQPTTEPVKPTTERKPTVSTIIYTDKVSSAQIISFLKDRITRAKNDTSIVNPIDVTNHWSMASVTLFVKLGIVSGYEDGSFHPDASISRAEFATIVAKAFNINGSSNSVSISDVNNHWAKESIKALASLGIIDGYEDGTFKPDKKITRAEIIAIISRIVDLHAVKKERGSFSDIQGSWNGAQIQEAANAGLVEGRDTNIFAPEAPSSRAESLTIVLRALELMPDIKILLDQMK